MGTDPIDPSPPSVPSVPERTDQGDEAPSRSSEAPREDRYVDIQPPALSAARAPHRLSSINLISSVPPFGRAAVPGTGEFSTVVGVVCGSCLSENLIAAAVTGHRFCTRCGDSLQLARKLSTSPFTRHQGVAIAFLKLSGLSGLDPEEATRLFETFRALVTSAITSVNGYAKIMGDKALLVVGTLATTEGASPGNVFHLMRAVQAIEKRIRTLASAPHSTVTLHAGAHVGEVVAGVPGVTGEKAYDVISADVNFAARLLGLSVKTGSIVVSDPVARQLGGEGVSGLYRQEGAILKGFPGAHPVYHLAVDFLEGRTGEIGAPDRLLPTHCPQHDRASTPYCPHCGNPSRPDRRHLELVGQKREVFVLSIDMMGFSSRAASMDPDDIARWITDFYAIAEPILSRHHGTIVHRIGDELIVRFGVPSVGIAGLNAVLAATDLRDALVAWNREQPANPIRFRIGIALGEALVKGSLTVGGVLDRSMEIQSSAPLDGVQVDAETASRIRGYFGEKETPWGVEVDQPDLGAIELLRRRRETPITGREREVILVTEAYQTSLRTGPTTLLLAGPEGSGRRAVVAHFESVHGKEAFLLSGTATAWRRDPLRAALRHLLDSMVGETALAKLDHLLVSTPFPRGGLTALPHAFESVMELMRYLVGRYLGVEVPKTRGIRYLRRNPKLLEEWTQIGVALLLTGLSAKLPLVVTLYHLEEADPESLAFISGILGRLEGRPVLVLATAEESLLQDESRRGVVQNLPRFESIHFKPLSIQSASQVILETLLTDPHPSEADLVRHRSPQRCGVAESLILQLYAQSGGYPLYLVELTRAYLEQGWIRWDGKVRQWTLELPKTRSSSVHNLDEILQARLDTLEPEERRLLAAASALAVRGGTFRAEALVSTFRETGDVIGQRLEKGVTALLARMEQRGLLSLVSTSTPGVTDYRITPPRLAVVAYQAMVGDDKRSIHESVYRSLSREATERSSADADALSLLAFHAEGAHRFSEAFKLVSGAAELGERLYLNDEVVGFLSDAERVLAKWNPPSREGLLFDLLARKGRVYERLSQREKWHETLAGMEALCSSEVVDDERRLTVLIDRGNYLVKMGEKDPEWFFRHEPFVAYRKEKISPQRVALFYYAMAKSLSISGRYSEAMAAYESALRSATRSDDPSVTAQILLGTSTLSVRLLDFPRAFEDGREAAAFFEQAEDYDNLCYALINMGDCRINQGEYADAIKHLRRAVLKGREIGNPIAIGFGLVNWGMALAYLGKNREGMERIDEALSLGVEIPSLNMSALIFRAIVVSPSDPDQGVGDAQEALRLFERYSQLPLSFQASAFFALGLSAFRKGDLLQAVSAVTEALKLRNQVESRRLEICDRELLQLASLLAQKTRAEGMKVPSPLLHAGAQVVSRSTGFEHGPDDPTKPRAESMFVLPSGAVAVVTPQVVRNPAVLEQSAPVPRLKVVRDGEEPPTFAGSQVVRESVDNRSAVFRLIVHRAIEEARVNRLEELIPILCVLYREPSLAEKVFRLTSRDQAAVRLTPAQRLLFRLAALRKDGALTSRLSEIYFGDASPLHSPIPVTVVGSRLVGGNALLRMVR